MKLLLTLLVRDEIDVIAPMLDYHLAHGVDAIIATDNGSVDGTRDVLAEYARRGCVRVLDEPPSDFSQHRWVTRMARLAHADYQADWVIHADTDELFVPVRHHTVKEALSTMPTELSVLKVQRHDFVPFDRRYVAPPQVEMRYRKVRSLNIAGRPLPPKVIHRGVAECTVTQGNHHVTGPELGEPADCQDIAIYHYPIRSYEQFASKVRNGGSGYARNRELARKAGFHKRHWYDLLLRGELEALYRAEYHHDASRLQQRIASGELAIDEKAARALSELPPAGAPP